MTGQQRRLWRAIAAVVGAGACLAAVVTPASAEWKRAESPRFILYSDGSEASLREFAQELESYDRVMRILMNLPIEQDPPRKLPIYLVRNHRGLESVWPSVPDSIVGFYTTGEEDIFAVAWRQPDNDLVLLHEYGHHFMLQNFANTAYPAWFVEGFAEYFATAQVRTGAVDIGRPNGNSALWLTEGPSWVPMSDLLSKRFSEIDRGRETYYPVSWILTHWFMSDPARKRQLDAYLADVNAGANSVEAMQRATGLNPDQLQRTLRSYIAGRALIRRITYPYPTVPVTVTSMGPSADAMLLLGQRLKRPVAEDQQAALLQQVRTLAGRWPDDDLAQIALARAELEMGDKALATQALTRILDRQPANVEALQTMAAVLMKEADEDQDVDASERLRAQARAMLGRAYRADDANFTTFSMLADTRRGQPGYPNDNDLETLSLAHILAPQLPGARFNLAAALIYRGEKDEAAAVLRPLLNDPHNAGIAAAARRMIEAAPTEAGSAAILDTGSDDTSEDPETPGD